MVMRMLGEMATANPSTGSFAAYARESLGDWAGFSVAWLYWYFWVIVVGFEAVAGAGILQKWLPDVPLWLMSLVLLLMMTATNLYSVKSYGEFEYWFAGIKVAAIFVFLVLGALYVLGLWPGHSLDFSNLYAHGGFFPNGVGAIFSGIVVVIFSMVGAEIATIAAAEIGRAGAGHRPRDQLRGGAHLHLLRRLDLPAGGHPAVEFQGAGRFGLCRRLRADGHRLGRQRHERGGAQRRAVLPQFRALHRLADAVRAGRPRRGAGAPARGQPQGRPAGGDPVLDADRLSVRRRGLRLTRHGVPVPAELLGCDHPVRLPADRHLAAGDAAEDPARPAAGEDVVLPGPHPAHDRRHGRWC